MKRVSNQQMQRIAKLRHSKLSFAEAVAKMKSDNEVSSNVSNKNYYAMDKIAELVD